MKIHFWFICLFLILGCSSPKNKVSSQDIKPEITKTPNTPKKKEEIALVTGPTKNNPDSPFKDKTKEYGLEGVEATHIYAVDFDQNGLTDLVVLPSFYSTPIFYKFSLEKKKFEKLSYNPFSNVLRASYLLFADFDKDGIQDVILGTLNQKTELNKFPLRIFQGKIRDGKVFYNEIKNAFPTGTLPTASIAIFDFDLDGQLDIYEANWFDYSGSRPVPIRDRLLKGDKFKFTDATVLLENESSRQEDIYLNARPTFGVSTCDINQDGYPDIMTSSSSGLSNKFWINIIDRQSGQRIYRDFAEVTGFASDSVGRLDPAGGGNSFFSICNDYNNDGIIDILSGELAHSYDPEKKDRSSILTGSTFRFPPSFIRTEYHLDDGTERWSQGDRRGSWLDYNQDGLLDILVDNSGFPPKSRLILFHQETDHAFTDMSEDFSLNILNPSGSVVADFNQDGRVDIITGQTKVRNSKIEPRVYFFENQYKRNGNRSLRVYLEGEQANRDGIGSMLMLKTKNSSTRQWVSNSSGGLPSQNEKGILFGISSKNSLEHIVVRWPSFNSYKKPKLKKYQLGHLKFKEYLDITLCESGKLLVGRNKSCLKKK